MEDGRIAAGAGLVLALESLHSFQLVLPPLYGQEKADPEDIQKAARFIAFYILILAVGAGIITKSPTPIILPAITIAILYFFYMYHHGNSVLVSLTDEEREDE